MPDLPRRAVDWSDGAIRLVDQTALPHRFERRTITTVDALIEAIGSLAVRGAPSLGAAGALGVRLCAQIHEGDEAAVRRDAERIASARPTAVNLRRAVEQALAALPCGAAALAERVEGILVAIAEANAAVAARSARHLRTLTRGTDLVVSTLCHTGWLATQEVGTGLGAIMELHRTGHLAHVYASETRPLLQGARLTCWELAEAGVPYSLHVDSAAAVLMSRGGVDAVVVGADRIAANGDTANKVGTLPLALAAHHFGVPFVVAAPDSTVDRDCPSGACIEIEERPPGEVRAFGGIPTTPDGAPVVNPAFDVTPHTLITAVVTEHGVYDRTA